MLFRSICWALGEREVGCFGRLMTAVGTTLMSGAGVVLCHLFRHASLPKWHQAPCVLLWLLAFPSACISHAAAPHITHVTSPSLLCLTTTTVPHLPCATCGLQLLDGGNRSVCSFVNHTISLVPPRSCWASVRCPMWCACRSCASRLRCPPTCTATWAHTRSGHIASTCPSSQHPA